MLVRWKQIRCQGKDKRGKPCRRIHCEVTTSGHVRFKCAKCGTWQVAEV